MTVEVRLLNANLSCTEKAWHLSATKYGALLRPAPLMFPCLYLIGLLAQC